MTPRRALAALVLVTALARLVWAAGLGPGHDEAYHALFATRLDWSFYDHPPMLALVERAGIEALGGSWNPFALRLGFIALFAGSTLLMARLTTRWFTPAAGLLAAVALNATAYFSLAAGAFALPDGPLVFFWILTLDRLANAFERGEEAPLAPWISVGLAWGCALLSKYHAVLLPVGTLLYLIWTPSARACLRRPGPYLALGIGLLCSCPF